MSESLDDLRRAIDAIDADLVNLLAQRAQQVKLIGERKAEVDAPAFVPDRESTILERVTRLNPGPFEAAHVRSIFREIISAGRNLEEPERVAHLGPAFTFSHEAALEHFGRSAGFVPLPTLRDVFEQVERGEATYGVVPVENSTSGTVGETLDLFPDHDVHVCSEIKLSISHNLFALERRTDYRVVYSHAQALQQCRIWLAHNMPGVTTTEVASTSEAARRAASEPGSAAIGPASAGDAHHLITIHRNIQDIVANQTRFYVIAARSATRGGSDKTALMLTVQDRVGALHDVLGVVRDHDINLTFIQSRPSRIKPGDYLFFLELSGHPDDALVEAALGGLNDVCVSIRVLGAWPVNQIDGLVAT